MKRTIAILVSAILFLSANAQVDLVKTNYQENTLVAPLYFGPNAFPVPDMTDGSTVRELTMEVAGDGFFGFQRDKTADIFARLRIPLFTDRVNLCLWMPVVEFYQSTDGRLASCRVLPENREKAMRGHEGGDVYVSTDIMFLREKAKCPAMTVRAAVKTASGGGFALARTYDAPGYFFDLSIGKSFFFGKDKNSNTWNSGNISLRLAATAGFLCWQTDNGRQNDAVMYGALLRLKHKYFSVEEVFSGYVGWEGDGDRPMTLKTKVAGHIAAPKAKGSFEPYVMYQYGIHDYPFHQLRIGLCYNIDILKKKDR
ncbi:MAG: hypothetical protein IJ776_02075 [Paludibacteraceae bacterium]|nr:hypothetical protein [Paludibacteraceae bacterium]